MELFIGAILGLLISLTLQAYFRPFAALMERIGRRHFANPLIVHVEHDPSIIWSGEPDWVTLSMYIDDPLRASRILARSRSDWVRQVRQLNAVDAYMTTLKITIQAKGDAAVVVESIRVVKLREIPLDKGMILTRATGGAELEPRRAHVDLEWGPEPVVTWPEYAGKSGAPPAFMLAAGEAEMFHVWAEATRSSEPVWHEWFIELHLLVEGIKSTWRIDDNGAPFVTVAPGDLPARINDDGAEWTGSAEDR